MATKRNQIIPERKVSPGQNVWGGGAGLLQLWRIVLVKNKDIASNRGPTSLKDE